MRNNFRVLIVDNSNSCCLFLKNLFQKLLIVDDYAFAFDGKNALELYQTFKPDIVVVEPLLPMGDGFELLEKIMNDPVIKIVATFVNQEFFIKKSIDLHADYIFIKPLDEALFSKRILEIIESVGNKSAIVSARETSSENHIANLLRKVGIPVNIKGFRYLKNAIEIVACDSGSIEGATKKLYNKVACNFNSTPTRVERNIRHAIEVAYNRGNPHLLNEIFGYTIDEDKGKPTNSEFIAMIADKILLEMNNID